MNIVALKLPALSGWRAIPSRVFEITLPLPSDAANAAKPAAIEAARYLKAYAINLYVRKIIL